jgi:hypothetical protein
LTYVVLLGSVRAWDSGSAPSGPSPQYKALLKGKISSKEYVRQLKERVDAERSAEKRSIRRPAAA